jgi:hypothetical protein
MIHAEPAGLDMVLAVILLVHGGTIILNGNVRSALY